MNGPGFLVLKPVSTSKQGSRERCLGSIWYYLGKEREKKDRVAPRDTSCGCTGVFVGGYLVIGGILIQEKIA